MTAEDTPVETSTTPTLQVEDIVTGYGQNEVLHGISMESHEGVTCIFGPNGSGKSTMLKAINGILPVWSGSVTYGERDLTDENPEAVLNAGIATLPQGGGVFGSLTVRENLQIGGFTESDQSALDARREDVLEAFPALEQKLGTKAESLSGGQQMMVSLGRAMMTGADTFLLDEPSAGLAPNLVDDAFDLVETLVERGARVMLVEQNVTAALRLADYVYILAEGDLQFEGEPSALADETDLLATYLGL